MYIDPSFKEYASVLQETKFLSEENKLPKEERKKPTHFHYGNVTLTAFEKKHVADGWGSRIFAIPLTALSPLNILGHLIVGAIVAKNKLPTITYMFVRDLEEIAGRIVTLFNDNIGSYMVQDALWQKNCYYYINNPPSKVFSFEAGDGIYIREPGKARKLTLWDFSHMPEEKKAKEIKKFLLETNIQAYDKAFEGGFWAQITRADEQMLRACTIYDLKTEQNLLFLHSLEILLTLKVEQVKDLSSRLQQALRQRFSSERREVHLQQDQDILTLHFVDFLNLPACEIDKRVNTLPAYLFALLSEQQAQEIDLALLSKEQLLSFINCHILSLAELKARFSRFTLEQISSLINELKGEQLKLISDELLSKVDLGLLRETQLSYLFPTDTEVDRRRIGSLPVIKLQAIVGKFDTDQLLCISDEQLPHLDLSHFTEYQIHSMFPAYTQAQKEESKRRIGLLPVIKLQAIVGKFNTDQLLCISDEQLPHLDLSLFTEYQIHSMFPTNTQVQKEESKRRIGLLPVIKLQAIVGKFNTDQLLCISDEQLPHLDLSHFTEYQIHSMFPTNTQAQKEESKRRIGLLPVIKLQAIVGKFDTDQLHCISDKQRAELDLSHFTEYQIHSMFPTNTQAQKEESKKRFGFFSGDQVMSILETSPEELSSWITKKQLTQIDVSKLTDAQIGKLFPSFNENALRKEIGGGGRYIRESRPYWDWLGREHIETKETEGFEDLIQKRKNKIKQSNLAKMKSLTPEQRDAIRARLTPENQELLSTLGAY